MDGAGAAETAVVLKEGAITAQTCVATVEHWGLREVILVLDPVPVLGK